MNSSPVDAKAELRREALRKRQALPLQARDRFTARLLDEGVTLARQWRPSIVSAFHPIRQEPDALALLDALAEAGFETALPVVAGREARLTFRLWRPGDPTAAGAMAIREPLASAPAVEPDLLFVPLACFDRGGHRIGYGAGYYDRTLERLRALKPVRAVGVAYGVCEVAAVPYEAHDQLLDAVVTERETIFVSER